MPVVTLLATFNQAAFTDLDVCLNVCYRDLAS